MLALSGGSLAAVPSGSEGNMKIRSMAFAGLVGVCGWAATAACSSTSVPEDERDGATTDAAAADGSTSDVLAPKPDATVAADASPDSAAVADAGKDASVPVPGVPTGVVVAAVPVVTTVSTLAGSGELGFLDGAPGVARFRAPTGLCVDSANNVYVADAGNNRVRKITPAGVVSTLAGGTQGYLDATGAAARFYDPFGPAVDAAGNVFVAEHFNHRIRKITAAGVVTTVAGSGAADFIDGTGVAAAFNHPQGLALTAAGDLLVSDTDNNRIRKVTQAGVVTTFAGSGAGTHADGTGTAASFSFPYNVAFDSAGNAYVGDQLNNRVRKITPAGVVTTIAGSGAADFAEGTGTAASFNDPLGVAVDPSGNVYVADYLNLRIRRISPVGVVTTHAGGAEADYVDGAGATARFNFASSVASAADGTLYVGDNGNVRIRKIVSSGIGRLAVSWAAPSNPGGAPITKYVATAVAPGMATATCTTTGATSCTFERLTSSVAYSVTVVATNAGGDGPGSSVSAGTPN